MRLVRAKVVNNQTMNKKNLLKFTFYLQSDSTFLIIYGYLCAQLLFVTFL